MSVYPVSAKLKRFVRSANLPRKTFSSSIESLFCSNGRSSHSMQVAESWEGSLPKRKTIFDHAAEVPKTELRGNLADCRS